MKLNHSLFWCTCIIGLSYLATPNRIQAQITPDATTSTQASQLENTFTITGGKEAGVNLFHSFTDFSVPEGKIASFVNNMELL